MNYDQAQKDIIKIIRKLSPKFGTYNVFRDFITMAACSISNGVDKRQYDVREGLYMSTVKKYDKDEANNIAKMLALTSLGMSGAKMGDFLGELYMELEIGNDDSGQFFTPYHISKLMAQLADHETDGIMTLHEPSVGSGGMIVAQAEVMKLKGLNYQTDLKVICNDVDYDVVKMCYIQLSLLGIDAVVMQGDSLTQKMNEYWYTPMHFMNKAREYDEQRAKRIVDDMSKFIELTKEPPKEQQKEPQRELQTTIFDFI